MSVTWAEIKPETIDQQYFLKLKHKRYEQF